MTTRLILVRTTQPLTENKQAFKQVLLKS